MRVRTGLAAVFILGALAAPASATSITVDEILYASGTNAANLSGTVEMTLVGSTPRPMKCSAMPWGLN